MYDCQDVSGRVRKKEKLNQTKVDMNEPEWEIRLDNTSRGYQTKKVDIANYN